MPNKTNEEQLKLTYAAFSDDQLREEFLALLAIPNARTNIEALTKMSVLMPEFDKRDLPMPTPSSRNVRANYNSTEESHGPNTGSLILGIVLIIGGAILSMNTDSIFYGAIIVGIIMVFRSF